MDFSPSGSSIHGILQARILEWVAVCRRGVYTVLLPREASIAWLCSYKFSWVQSVNIQTSGAGILDSSYFWQPLPSWLTVLGDSWCYIPAPLSSAPHLFDHGVFAVYTPLSHDGRGPAPNGNNLRIDYALDRVVFLQKVTFLNKKTFLGENSEVGNKIYKIIREAR